ncbi:MAG: DUF4276 family protein [Bryobacteraceae bacterium]
MEGGGDTAATKAELRQGMSEFLGSLVKVARQNRISWKIVFCGSRNFAHDAFLDATRKQPDTLNLLLVDSEGPVEDSPIEHLRNRDSWELDAVPEELVQVMVQVMETWLVADSQALASYYGQDFLKGSLPRAVNLETVPKTQIEQGLKRATERTQKGEYHKIHHAGKLLAKINPELVRRRCPACDRLFLKLSAAIRRLKAGSPVRS